MYCWPISVISPCSSIFIHFLCLKTPCLLLTYPFWILVQSPCSVLTPGQPGSWPCYSGGVLTYSMLALILTLWFGPEMLIPEEFSAWICNLSTYAMYFNVLSTYFNLISCREECVLGCWDRLMGFAGMMKLLVMTGIIPENSLRKTHQ